MRVTVQDANILIDLELAELLDPWLELGIETHTTDFIVHQLLRGNHLEALSRIRENRIQTHSLDATEMLEMMALYATFSSGPDLNDCSALYLARKLDALLLTGDKPLRLEAERRGVEVHGTLWIMDMLVSHDILSPGETASRLRRLLAAARFLPARECEIRLHRWR